MLWEHTQAAKTKGAPNRSLCYMLQFPHCQRVPLKQCLLHVADKTSLKSQQFMNTDKCRRDGLTTLIPKSKEALNGTVQTLLKEN